MSDLSSRQVGGSAGGSPSGSLALVTGAARGIGQAIALALAQRGYHVVLAGRSAAALDAVAAQIAALGAGRASVHVADLAVAAEADALVPAVVARHGPLLALINNAGERGRAAHFADYQADEWDRVLDVNLRAPATLCLHAARLMRERRQGHIVNVLTSACLGSYETYAAYTAAKKGLEGLTRVLSKELRSANVRVTALFPGGTDSREAYGAETPYLRPQEVADVVCAILASERAVLQEVVVRTLDDPRQ